MKTVNNRHNEFVESLRNIMRDKEKKKNEPANKRKQDYDEETQRIQKLLEEKFDELFGTVDSDAD